MITNGAMPVVLQTSPAWWPKASDPFILAKISWGSRGTAAAGAKPPAPFGQKVRAMTTPNPLRAYAAVTAAYWAFMLSDGALRMLVLLHFNGLGFSPVQLAWLFL